MYDDDNQGLESLLQEQGKAFGEFKTKVYNRLGSLELKAGRPGVGYDPTTSHSKSEYDQNSPLADPGYKQAWTGFFKTGRNIEDVATALGFDKQINLTKAMQSTTGSDGGYLVPSEFDSLIDETLRDASPMRQVCTVKKVNTSDYKKIINLHGSGHGWVGETDARPHTDTPTVEEVTPYVGEVYANPQISQHLLDDSYFNLEDFIQDEVGGLFAVQEGNAFVSGDGVNKPRGFLDYGSATTADNSRAFGVLQHTIVAGEASITADELLSFVYQLRAAYRKNAVWLMNSQTLAAIRSLKDVNGQYIWQSGLALGQPETLLGKPVHECPDMPAMASGNTPIAFGDFKKGYYILDRSSLLLRDPYSNKPLVGFYTTRRVGGMVVDSQAIKLIQMA